jgi:hypothetical protein
VTTKVFGKNARISKAKIEKRKGKKGRCFHKHSQKQRNPHD